MNVFTVPFSPSNLNREDISVQKTERMFVRLFPGERRIVFIIVLLKRKGLDVYGEKFLVCLLVCLSKAKPGKTKRTDINLMMPAFGVPSGVRLRVFNVLYAPEKEESKEFKGFIISEIFLFTRGRLVFMKLFLAIRRGMFKSLFFAFSEEDINETKKAVIIFIMPAFLVFDGSRVNVFTVPFSPSKLNREDISVQKTERMFAKLFPGERRIVFIIVLLKRKGLDVYGEKFLVCLLVCLSKAKPGITTKKADIK